MIRDLQLVIEWLDNLEAKIGTDALLDAMPNDWQGRIALGQCIKALEYPAGPWSLDAESGQIRDANGWALATVPHAIAGDEGDLANGRLMATAPALAAHLDRLVQCLDQAVDFAVTTSPGTGHNAGIWATAAGEARALLGSLGLLRFAWAFAPRTRSEEGDQP